MDYNYRSWIDKTIFRTWMDTLLQIYIVLLFFKIFILTRISRLFFSIYINNFERSQLNWRKINDFFLSNITAQGFSFSTFAVLIRFTALITCYKKKWSSTFTLVFCPWLFIITAGTLAVVRAPDIFARRRWSAQIRRILAFVLISNNKTINQYTFKSFNDNYDRVGKYVPNLTRVKSIKAKK